jgi:hypothetical protein
MPRSALPAGNNAVAVILEDLKNVITKQFENSATVSCVVYQAGTTEQVAGQSWPLLMPYTGTPGRYAGVISETAEIVENTLYDITVTMRAGLYTNTETVRALAKERVILLST